MSLAESDRSVWRAGVSPVEPRESRQHTNQLLVVSMWKSALAPWLCGWQSSRNSYVEISNNFRRAVAAEARLVAVLRSVMLDCRYEECLGAKLIQCPVTPLHLPLSPSALWPDHTRKCSHPSPPLSAPTPCPLPLASRPPISHSNRSNHSRRREREQPQVWGEIFCFYTNIFISPALTLVMRIF